MYRIFWGAWFLGLLIGTMVRADDSASTRTSQSTAPATMPAEHTKVGFFGLVDHAERVVFVFDHSASVLDNYKYLIDGVKSSIQNLGSAQQFAVVTFSEEAAVLGPLRMQLATDAVKDEICKRIDKSLGGGESVEISLSCQHAFEKAFAMKPQLIYFLTDGAFNPKLLDTIRLLNKDSKIRIDALAFVSDDPRYEQQLKDIAKENGGQYRFVSQKELWH